MTSFVFDPTEPVHHLIDLAPVLVVDTVRDQQARLINPPVSMNELLVTFEQLGLSESRC
jgi:hypothetical protein